MRPGVVPCRKSGARKGLPYRMPPDADAPACRVRAAPGASVYFVPAHAGRFRPGLFRAVVSEEGISRGERCGDFNAFRLCCGDKGFLPFRNTLRGAFCHFIQGGSDEQRSIHDVSFQLGLRRAKPIPTLRGPRALSSVRAARAAQAEFTSAVGRARVAQASQPVRRVLYKRAFAPPG